MRRNLHLRIRPCWSAWLLGAGLLLGAASVPAAEHPRLVLTAPDVETIRASLPSSPSFVEAIARMRADMDNYFAALPDVPVPKDAGGGYTHERHKKNGMAIFNSGTLYQLTGERKYANHARDLLLAYARLYPTLGEHPRKKEQTPGRMFWQSLNESVWLVYAIQGYDAIVESLTARDRAAIEQGLLRPLADFLSVESPQVFQKIHNHGTWAVAAVGMTGYVLGDENYVQQALYGLDKGGEAGFLKQIDLLFSPDGYYNEGPYYLRYALMPFVLFARSIEANDPELGIFRYRDSVLLKAVHTCMDTSYAGLFFPINDAIKDKGLDTVELRYGVAIAYSLTGDDTLLSIAQEQKTYVLTGDGFRLAQAIDRGRAKPYGFKSVFLRDGSAGDKGALVVLRDGSAAGHQALVFKATAQGMGHGHFDKLNWLYYDNGTEIVSDYGAARFLNVEQKFGGHYLPENASWAKQTVAHNTLVVDERSHFDGKLSVAERFHPKPMVYEVNERVHIVGAIMKNAYDGVSFSRTLALLRGVVPVRPIVIDVLNVGSTSPHQYDLPLHFKGHVIDVSAPMKSKTRKLEPLGDGNGYQHLWLRAKSTVGPGESLSMTWINGNRFYTYTTLAQGKLDVMLTELGANDPNFNLRSQQALILRAKNARSYSFVSVLEAHGEYSGSEEYTLQSAGSVSVLQRYSNNGADLIRIVTRDGNERLLGLSYNPRPEQEHQVSIGDRDFRWKGYYKLFEPAGGS